MFCPTTAGVCHRRRRRASSLPALTLALATALLGLACANSPTVPPQALAHPPVSDPERDLIVAPTPPAATASPAPADESAHAAGRPTSGEQSGGDPRGGVDERRAADEYGLHKDRAEPAPAEARAMGGGPTAESGLGEASAVGRSRAKRPAHKRPARRRLKDAAKARAGDRSATELAPLYSAPPPVVEAPAIKAGRHDDNKQYNRFLKFLADNRPQVVYPQDISERIVLRTLDKNGDSLYNCRVNVLTLEGQLLSRTTTFADGRTMFFPRAVPNSAAHKDYTIDATCGRQRRKGQLQRHGKRHVDIGFASVRQLPARVPVDIAIVIDTTGSMSDQIERLKKTLRAIHFQLSQTTSRPDLRFALVAYRDTGDDYRTRVTPFTSHLDQFQTALNLLDADGGGDTPEDLQEALRVAMTELKWRAGALRLGFAISDAIPHTDYGQAYTYRSAMIDGLARAIKWSMVGAGGLGRDGEVIFRQVSQFTMGEYVFVTQGGGGDHEGSHAEASHHVGSNYKTENLDQAIVRIVRRELSYLTRTPRDFDDTIVATGTPDTPRSLLLAPAVKEILRQLVDYSALAIAPRTPLAVFPVATPASYKAVGEYLSEQFILDASRHKSFKVVERDITALDQEFKLQFSDMFDVEETVPIGKLTGAQILLVAKLSVAPGGKDIEIFAKLVRVETGEMLAVAKASLLGMANNS